MNSAAISVAAGGAGRSIDTPTRGDRATSAPTDDTVAPFDAQLWELLAPARIKLDLAPLGAVGQQRIETTQQAMLDPRAIEGAATAAARDALRAPHSSVQPTPLPATKESEPASHTAQADPAGTADRRPSTGQPPADEPSAARSEQPASERPTRGDPQPPVASQVAKPAASAASAPPAATIQQPPQSAELVALLANARTSGPTPASAAPSAGQPSAVGAIDAARGASANAAKARAASAAHPMPKQPPMAQLASALAQAIKRGDGTVQLTLKPSTLGQVQVSLAIEGSSVNARFEARAESAQQLLSQSIDHLRAQLAQRGLQLEQVEVVTVDDQREGQDGARNGYHADAQSHARHHGTSANTGSTSDVQSADEDTIDLTPLFTSAGRLDTIA